MSENSGLSESIWNATRTSRFLAVSITFTFAAATGAYAQESAKTFGYYTNANTTGVPDARMSVVNPGSVNGFSPAGDLCANIYVFRSDQQMMECCSCKVTPDGLRTFSVNMDLTNNPLVAAAPQTGAIKIVSSAVPAGGSCNNIAGTAYKASGLLGAWITHVNATTPGAFSVSETNFFPGALSATELSKVQQQCLFIENNGRGVGICTCGSE